MEPGEFAARYVAALDDLGYAADASHRLTDPIPDWLPRSLRELYLVAGNHPINRMHHRLLLPDEVELRGPRAVFAEENQQVVFWAFDRDDPASDPLVWQGQPVPGDSSQLVWYSEERTLSEFMIEMWTWVSGGQ